MKQEDLKKVEQELNDEELNDVAGGNRDLWNHIKPEDYPSAPGQGGETPTYEPGLGVPDLSNPD